MQVKAILSQKNSIAIEVGVLIIFLVGMYYLYTLFSQSDPVTTTSTSSINQRLIGENLGLFLKAVNQDRFSLKDTSFLDSSLVRQLQDFSEVISPNATRGRIDPFTPYASTRSLR